MRYWLSALAVVLLLAVTACSASLPTGESGSITLVPFFHEESGIRGVVPVGCEQTDAATFDCAESSGTPAIIIQQAAPATCGEVLTVVENQFSLEPVLEPTGRSKGEAFAWDLYAFDARNPEIGPEVYRMDMALAAGETACHIVAMITEPAHYAADEVMYGSLFNHMVYGQAPWE